jgi:DNA-binding IclR family transcriptional regulator
MANNRSAMSNGTASGARPGEVGRPYYVQSLERGLLALAALRDAPRGDLALSELAQAIGLNRSTLHRLLATLLRHGYVEQDPPTRRYRLGLAHLEMAHQAVEHLELRRRALRTMHALPAETGESVYLNVRSGTRTLCIDEVVGPRGVTLGSNVGVAMPLHSAAAGKCYLAWMEPAGRDALLDRLELARVTERTITSREALLTEVERVRRQGYAVNDEESEPGVRYAAAPVFDAAGDVTGALALGAPVLRIGPGEVEKLGAAVIAAAGRISASLGYREQCAGSGRARGVF